MTSIRRCCVVTLGGISWGAGCVQVQDGRLRASILFAIPVADIPLSRMTRTSWYCPWWSPIPALRLSYVEEGEKESSLSLSSWRDLREVQRAIEEHNPNCDTRYLPYPPWRFWVLPLAGMLVSPLSFLVLHLAFEVAAFLLFAMLFLNWAAFALTASRGTHRVGHHR